MTITASVDKPAQPKSWLRRHVAVRAFLTAPSGVASVVALAVLVGVAVVAPLYLDARATETDIAGSWAGVGADHWLGTDALGRDTFARVMVATRLTLLLGLAAGAISIGLGVAFGLLAAVSRGRWRTALLRGLDAALCIPAILMAIFAGAIFGGGVNGAVVGVGLALCFPIARITSTLALSIGGREYISAARVLGVRPLRLMFRYTLPNISESLVVAFTLSIVSGVLFISALSFLGLGTQAPEFDWGGLLSEGVANIAIAPAGALGPAIAIAFTALTLSLTGEALARACNPVLWTSSRKQRRAAPPEPTAVPVAAPAETEGGEPVLRVDDLVVTVPGAVGPVDIVKGVSFAVAPGQVLGIVGESGSGKTMTALAVAGLAPPSGTVGGTITLTGRRLADLSKAELDALLARELSVVFQDPSSALNPALRVGVQMTLSARIIRKLRRSAAYQLAAAKLRDVHIGAPDRQLKAYPHQLSGGMRQRVMIGTGLMAEPSVLIADEPTTALDVTVQAQIMDLLEEINTGDRSTSIILISHNLALVSQNCDRVLVMYCGRIVEDLDLDQLLTDPKHPYTRALLAAMPKPGGPREAPMATIGGEVPDIAAPPAGCPFHPRCAVAVDRCRTDLPPLVIHPEDRARRVACHVVEGAGV